MSFQETLDNQIKDALASLRVNLAKSSEAMREFQESDSNQVAALKHCLSEVADIVELLDSGEYESLNIRATKAYDKLNELVVYIAGQLNPS